MGSSIRIVNPNDGRVIRANVSNNKFTRVLQAANFYRQYNFVPKAFKVNKFTLDAVRQSQGDTAIKRLPSGFRQDIESGNIIGTKVIKRSKDAPTRKERLAFAKATGTKAINVGFKREGQLISTVRKSVLKKAQGIKRTKVQKKELPPWAKNVKNFASLSSVAKKKLQRQFEFEQRVKEAEKKLRPQVEKKLKEISEKFYSAALRKSGVGPTVQAANKTKLPTKEQVKQSTNSFIQEVKKRASIINFKGTTKSDLQRLEENVEVINAWKRNFGKRIKRVDDFFSGVLQQSRSKDINLEKEFVFGNDARVKLAFGKSNIIGLPALKIEEIKSPSTGIDINRQKVGAKLLGLPTKLTLGTAEQIGIAGTTAGTIGIGAKVNPEGTKREAISAAKKAPIALIKTFDPRTSDGLANIIGLTGSIAFGVAAGKRANIITPKKNVPIKATSNVMKAKVGSKFNIQGTQKGSFINKLGKKIDFVRNLKISSKTGKGTANIKYFNSKGKLVATQTQKITPKLSTQAVTNKIGQVVKTNSILKKSLGKLFEKRTVRTQGKQTTLKKFGIKKVAKGKGDIRNLESKSSFSKLDLERVARGETVINLKRVFTFKKSRLPFKNQINKISRFIREKLIEIQTKRILKQNNIKLTKSQLDNVLSDISKLGQRNFITNSKLKAILNRRNIRIKNLRSKGIKLNNKLTKKLDSAKNLKQLKDIVKLEKALNSELKALTRDLAKATKDLGLQKTKTRATAQFQRKGVTRVPKSQGEVSKWFKELPELAKNLDINRARIMKLLDKKGNRRYSSVTSKRVARIERTRQKAPLGVIRHKGGSISRTTLFKNKRGSVSGGRLVSRGNKLVFKSRLTKPNGSVVTNNQLIVTGGSKLPFFKLPSISGLSPLFINLTGIIPEIGITPKFIPKILDDIREKIDTTIKQKVNDGKGTDQKDDQEQIPDQDQTPTQRQRSRGGGGSTRPRPPILETILVPTTTATAISTSIFINRYLKPTSKKKKSSKPTFFEFTPAFWRFLQKGQSFLFLPDLYAIITGERASKKQKIRLLQPGRIFTGLERRSLVR